jgi:hypothetical protein
MESIIQPAVIFALTWFDEFKIKHMVNPLCDQVIETRLPGKPGVIRSTGMRQTKVNTKNWRWKNRQFSLVIISFLPAAQVGKQDDLADVGMVGE